MIIGTGPGRPEKAGQSKIPDPLVKMKVNYYFQFLVLVTYYYAHFVYEGNFEQFTSGQGDEKRQGSEAAKNNGLDPDPGGKKIRPLSTVPVHMDEM
jgi:hypothetical protein